MKQSMRGALAAMLVATSMGWVHPGKSLAAEPVKLVVGYQPYDTISYSAVVIRALSSLKVSLAAIPVLTSSTPAATARSAPFGLSASPP